MCEQVAAGLGLPAHKGHPPTEVTVSAALTQILAEPGPVDGRKLGIIADAGSDLAGITKLFTAARKVGVTALVIAPTGGVLKAARRAVTVDRTLLTARSIEFDALVVAGGTTPTKDIKLVVLLQEAFRHCKALAAWGDGTALLAGAGISTDSPGIDTGDQVDKACTNALIASMGLHRAWDRATQVMASAVPPARAPRRGRQRSPR